MALYTRCYYHKRHYQPMSDTCPNLPPPAPNYRRAAYLTSAAKLSQCPPDQGWEVAFAGRSNAGKSSAINS